MIEVYFSEEDKRILNQSALNSLIVRYQAALESGDVNVASSLNDEIQYLKALIG